MRWNDIGGITCSVARTLSVVGDRWTLLILRDAFLRTRRFEDFQAHLGMTRHRLADRLAKLVEHGVFERVRYQERPERYEYRLTEKGRDLYPVIVSLVGWGDRWMALANVYYYAVIAVMVLGLPFWLLRMDRRHVLIWAPFVVYTAMWTFFFVGEARYHFPLLPVFAVLAGIGASAFLRTLLRERAPLSST